MKVFISGVAGFIGSHLSEFYLNKGWKVSGIDNLSTGNYENIRHLEKNKSFHFIFGDVLDKDVLNKSIGDSDIVIHLAAAVGVKYIIENPIKSIVTNVKGTENILEIVHKKNIPVFIASTSEVYGKNTNIPLKEDDDRVCGSTSVLRWNYSCSKALDEFMALAFYREKKIPVVIGRFFNTCGPRQVGDYGMVIPKFVKQAMLDMPITVFGDGKQSRCFTHVNDVVKAIFDLMNNKECYGQVFNIGSDNSITISELAEKIVKTSNSSSQIEYLSYDMVYGKDFEDMMVRQPSLEKIKKYTGFEYTYSIDEIISDVLEYYKGKEL